MVHRLYNYRTMHIDTFAKSTLFKEIPDFRRKSTELAWQFQVAGNQFGIVADNLIRSLGIFDRIFSLKELLHRDKIECLVLELLDIGIGWLAGKRIRTEPKTHHI